MWLDLEVPRAYRIDEIMDHRLFVSALPLLLIPTDTVVFSTYGSRVDVVRFFVEHELPPDDFVLHERCRAAIYHEDNPGSTVLDEVAKKAAWAINAEPSILSRLANLFDEKSEATDLCDHIAAYNSEMPLFIFHDAFKSDHIYITTRIPEERVAAFSRALGKAYYIHVFPQVAIAPETRAAINRIHVGMSEEEVIAIMEPVTFHWGKNTSNPTGATSLSFGVAILQSFSIDLDSNSKVCGIPSLDSP